MPKMNLTEATILALQGKLNLEESIDISIQDDSTMIDTDESTVIIQNKEELEDVEDTECEDCEEPEVVEVPIEGEETIIPEQEIPEEQVEEITSEEVPTVEEIADGETDLDESKQLKEKRLGNKTFTDEDEAEYYRNKELYADSGLAKHREAMEKAKQACDKKGIEVDETQGVYESKKIKTEDVDQELGTEQQKLTSDMTDEEIVDYIINNYEDITGEEVDSVFADGTNATEDSPIFNQEVIDSVSDKILKVLDDAGITGKRLEDVLYLLDDKLAMIKTGEVEEEPEPEFAESEPELNESKEIKTEERAIDANSEVVNKKISRMNVHKDVVSILGNGAIKLADKYNIQMNTILDNVEDTIVENSNLFESSLIKEYSEESNEDNSEEEKEPVKEGFSKQSFNEVFTKYYKDTISKTESFETTKVLKNDKAIKVEGKLNLTNGNSKDITLTLNKVQEGTSFTKYELHESGLLKESKSSTAKLMTRTNDNVIKCCYITK